MGRYRRWLATLVDHRKTATSPAMWCRGAAAFLTILGLVAYVPPIARWFHLQFWPAVVCFAPSFVFGLWAGAAEHRGQLSLARYGAFHLIECSLLQFFFAALVALSRAPGSFALASLYVLILAFHGFLNRTSFRFPYSLVGSLLAALAAILLVPDRETITTFAFVLPTGMFVTLLMGQAGLQDHAGRKERDQLRQAIHYRLLSERAEAHNAMSRRVMDLLSYNHDAGNTLSTVFMNAQLLGETIAELPDTAGAAQIRAKIGILLDQLDALKALINRGHALADDMPSLAPAPLRDAVDAVATDCRSLFPAVAIEVVGSEGDQSRVRVHEGPSGLRRILENVLYNACEGNGTDAARMIKVEIAGRQDTVVLRCRDDGPGFQPRQLGAPPAPFETTKVGGHGLGLFSVSHLVRASGGELSLSNAPGGGAVVDIVLPRDELEAGN